MEISIGSFVDVRKKSLSFAQNQNFGLVVGVVGTDPLGNTLYDVMVNGTTIIKAWNDELTERSK